MSFGSWLWGASQLDDAIDKATSELLPASSEDIALNLEICDQIRSKSVPAKDAMRALKRRLNHKNPNVQLLALGLTDICIKNGGDLFLAEVASREFMDNLISILQFPTLNPDVNNAILRLVQNWSVAFEGKPSLSYVDQVYKTLMNEGYKFPPKDLAAVSSAMVDTQTAPEWIDSEVCLRCRTAFSFTNRKHHCRNCGRVFDQQCSSKVMALPHFGITQEVRVCDGCYSKLTKKAEMNKIRRHSTSLHGSRSQSARELAEAELQQAIQLSLQEVSSNTRPGYVPYQLSPSEWQISEPPIVDHSTDRSTANGEDGPDLRAAIEASLREANAPKPSAPIALDGPRTEDISSVYGRPGYSQSYPPGFLPSQPPVPKIPSYDLEPLEADAILTFNQTVERVQDQGGSDLSRYPAVTELYDKANHLRPHLALSMDDAGRKEQMLADMHNKLSEAVKLYDQLLTQQIEHPRWSSPQSVASPHVSYQPATSAYSTGYNTVNGYNQQWAPQSQAPTQSSPYIARPQPESSQTTHSSATLIREQGQRYEARTDSSQIQQAHQYGNHQYDQYSQHSASPQLSSIQASAPSLRSSFPSQYTSLTPNDGQILPSVTFETQHMHDIGPSMGVEILPSAPPSILSLVSLTHSQPSDAQYMHSLAPTPSVPDPNVSSIRSRHNTVAYAISSPPLSPSTNSPLAQNSTIFSPSRQQQQHRASPQQVAYLPQEPTIAPPTPTSLPQFPVAPTSNPQSFPMYSPSISASSFEQVERKEAALIDL